MPYVHTCSRCKRTITTQDGTIPVCGNAKCRASRHGGKMTRGRFIPPCASCGGELIATRSGYFTCMSCNANGLMSLDAASHKYHEAMRPTYEAERRERERVKAEKLTAVSGLPIATIVPNTNLFLLDGAGYYRRCKPTDSGATVCLIVRKKAKVGHVRRAKRIGGMSLAEIDKIDID